MKKIEIANFFSKHILPLENDLFYKLSSVIDFETLGKGRKGNIIVIPDNENIPIIRTTTNYTKPAHIFPPSFEPLMKSIKDVINPRSLNVPFNNIMIEVYDQHYTKMGYHSDQCLDLENNSFIALFSFYERPTELSSYQLRKLKIREKSTNEEYELLLENNTLILFSLETNTKFEHKIVLDYPNIKTDPKWSDNQWLGLTFRKSKTFIHFKDNIPYFQNGEMLEIANENQRKDFFMLKAQENNQTNFIYPYNDMKYTLSISDTLPPI